MSSARFKNDHLPDDCLNCHLWLVRECEHPVGQWVARGRQMPLPCGDADLIALTAEDVVRVRRALAVNDTAALNAIRVAAEAR